MSVRFVLAIAATASMAALGVSHQAIGQAPACKWTPRDTWVQQQAAFFDDAKGGWTNDSLRRALLIAAESPGLLQAPVQLGIHVVGTEKPLDPNAAVLVTALRAMARKGGAALPTKRTVGAAGVHAVYLLAQRDTGLIKSVDRFKAGPAAFLPADLAMWEDRRRVLTGRKQLYGTQLLLDMRGRPRLAPMEDSAHVDGRRAAVSLPPFTLGLCFAKYLSNGK